MHPLFDCSSDQFVMCRTPPAAASSGSRSLHSCHMIFIYIYIRYMVYIHNVQHSTKTIKKYRLFSTGKHQSPDVYHIYIYIYIYIYMYIHTYIHTYMCIHTVLRPSVSLQSCDASSAALAQAETAVESCRAFGFGGFTLRLLHPKP